MATRMICEGNYKLIYYPAGNRRQLFDLASDPQELCDLAGKGDHARALDRLTEKLIGELYGSDLAWLDKTDALIGLPDRDVVPPATAASPSSAESTGPRLLYARQSLGRQIRGQTERYLHRPAVWPTITSDRLVPVSRASLAGGDGGRCGRSARRWFLTLGVRTMKRLFLALVVFVGLVALPAAPALADHCPLGGGYYGPSYYGVGAYSGRSALYPNYYQRATYGGYRVPYNYGYGGYAQPYYFGPSVRVYSYRY